jgi:hypothetical protein
MPAEKPPENPIKFVGFPLHANSWQLVVPQRNFYLPSIVLLANYAKFAPLRHGFSTWFAPLISGVRNCPIDAVNWHTPNGKQLRH